MARPLGILLFLAAVLPAGALPALDRIQVGEGEARAYENGIPVTVRGSWNAAIQGYSFSVWYNPRDLSAASVSYAGAPAEALLPEYFNSTLDAARGNMAAALLFEISDPFELVSLPPSPDLLQPLATVLFDVLPSAVPGPTPLRLAKSSGRYPIRNIFVDLGNAIEPVLEDGTFRILPVRFRRGFVNRDARLDLSDAIFLINYIFLGGLEPECLPSANVNGDSRLDLSDSIWLIGYIFRGTAPPRDPFQECGDDPRGPFPAACEGPAACP